MDIGWVCIIDGVVDSWKVGCVVNYGKEYFLLLFWGFVLGFLVFVLDWWFEWNIFLVLNVGYICNIRFF